MNREKAKQILESWLLRSKGREDRLGYIEGWFYKEDIEAFNMAIEALSEPTLVRCKDCKFRDESQRVMNFDGKEIHCECECIGGYMLEDDFCSYGERSDNE